MGKHGKRVKVDERSSIFDQNPDVFSNPDLLDQYLTAMGVGEGTPVPISISSPADIDFSALGITDPDEDSEDAGAAIADMLMERMGGTPRRKNYDKSIPVKSAKVIKPRDEKPRATVPNNETQQKTEKKKVRSNIALIKNSGDNTMRWLSIRDHVGNGTSAPIVGGDTALKQADLDAYLDMIYTYRKITGLPVAVYYQDDFTERFLRNGIYSVDDQRYMFLTDDAFDDGKILVFIIDENEKNEFKEYLRQQLTLAEISDTGLSITGLMRDTSILVTNIAMANWILDTLADDIPSKEALELDILNSSGTNQDPDIRSNPNSVLIDFDNFSNMIDSGFYHICSLIKDTSEDVTEEEPSETDNNPSETVENFDPYATMRPSAEEREEQGASEDGESFPDSDNESDGVGTIRISGEDNPSTGEPHDVSTGSTASGDVVCENASDHSEEEKEGEETGVPVERGDRRTPELEKGEGEEVQKGDGHSEIAEVDPTSFKFEEEEKAEDSMVISVTTVSRK